MHKKGTKIKIFTISIHCSKCSELIYRYQKEGPGSLVKCYVDRIVEDYTKGNLKCLSCGQDFARHAIMHNRPVHKIIQGKVYIKGHVKK
ncbi:hypothetical protein C4544_04205 [candidate division WS5 bacterium]|uniref:Uncharacterized protein n=1 Tax=candidate division WS5 bacterium TaxID=2093353 RepID=A0A419DCZ7_9BACT|nr:MAG: hypothetical protein C4544_04205 [candidate division WS5 bacterium]